MRILAIMLDFDLWRLGRTWSYSASYAVIDGLRSQGIEVVVVPSLVRAQHGVSNPWVELAPSLLAGETFDQAWIWVTHSHYTDEFWQWLEATVPVRVGVLMESLRYTPEESAEVPILATRYADVSKELRHVTHVLTYDEQDAAELAQDLGVPTRLFHLMLPESMVAEEPAGMGDRFVFIGSAYPTRARYMEREQVAEFIDIVRGPEVEMGLDRQFDEMNAAHLMAAKEGRTDLALMASHAAGLHAIRRRVLEAMLDSYRAGRAMVNLPALFKGFPGRVLEAMAAGVPVITNPPPDRPQTLALFEGDRHIMYYDERIPGDLWRTVERLKRDQSLCRAIADAALRRVRSDLTSEVQIAAILSWLPSRPSRTHGLLRRVRSWIGL